MTQTPYWEGHPGNPRTTFAPYKEGDKPYPWDTIYHTCPSNIAWLTFAGDAKNHLVPRAWIEDTVPPYPVFPPGALATGNIRSDGMIWTAFRPIALCGAKIPLDSDGFTKNTDVGRIVDVQIGMWRHDACLECWEKRW